MNQLFTVYPSRAFPRILPNRELLITLKVKVMSDDALITSSAQMTYAETASFVLQSILVMELRHVTVTEHSRPFRRAVVLVILGQAFALLD